MDCEIEIKVRVVFEANKGRSDRALVKKKVWGNVRSYRYGDIPGYQEISLTR
jgi:hypothetical protein